MEMLPEMECPQIHYNKYDLVFAICVRILRCMYRASAADVQQADRPSAVTIKSLFIKAWHERSPNATNGVGLVCAPVLLNTG